MMVIIRDGNTWMDEDGQYTTDRSKAKKMVYEVAEAVLRETWRGDTDPRWIVSAEPPRIPLIVRWLQFQIDFLESFREPADTTMFPGWITKQVNRKQAKIDRIMRYR